MTGYAYLDDGADVRRELRMLNLVLSFPTLSEKVVSGGLSKLSERWDPSLLNRWCRSSPEVTSGSRAAAKFVLWVWNPKHRWSCGRFDLEEALKCWDAQHLDAFTTWAQSPWWP